MSENPKNDYNMAARSKQHLTKVQAVYRKNPTLIDEFILALEFDCATPEEPFPEEDSVKCLECVFANKELEECDLPCEQGVIRRNRLMKIIRGDDPK